MGMEDARWRAVMAGRMTGRWTVGRGGVEWRQRTLGPWRRRTVDWPSPFSGAENKGTGGGRSECASSQMAVYASASAARPIRTAAEPHRGGRQASEALQVRIMYRYLGVVRRKTAAELDVAI